MDLIVTDKVLNTDPIKNLLRQGEANVDSPVIVLDKTYNGIDISGYTFTLRAASDKNTLVSRVLQKEVLTDKIRLTWEVVPEYTAVPGSLHITIVGTSATGEDIIKITADAINVLSDPSSWSAPSPDVVADAINQMTAILVDATAEANRAAAEADRLIDVGVRFRVMGAFDTLAALEAAVTAPAVGDAYQVGTTDADRVIYLWDGTTWINMGAIQGAQGPAGPKGDPSTVCGKMADASGNIALDTTDLLMTGYTKPTSGGDIAGTDTLMQAIQRLAYNVGLLSNPNLLINWDFRNPVNQRGQISYTGYTYTIDMWKLNGTVTIKDGYISAAATSQYDAMFTTVEKYKSLQNSTVTLTAKVKGISGKNVGIALLIDGTNVLAKDFVLTGDWQYISITTQLTTISTSLQWLLYPGFQSGGGSCDIETTKFELGSISTLANDPPANYGEQLALCQRYQIAIPVGAKYAMVNYASSYIDFFIPCPTPMRVSPNIIGNLQVKSIDGLTTYDGFTFAPLGANNPTGLLVRATKTAHGLTTAFVNVPDGIILDANI